MQRVWSMKLKDFAKLVGLSSTTVSRALGGYPEVNEKTRKRIMEAALKHGYVPNAHAKSLSTGASNTIACVIPVTDQNEIMNPIFGEFMAGVCGYCGKNGFEVSLKIVPDDDQITAYRAIRSRADIGGIIIQSPRHLDDRIPMLAKVGLPFVVHGRSSGVDQPGRVATDAGLALDHGGGHHRRGGQRGDDAGRVVALYPCYQLFCPGGPIR